VCRYSGATTRAVSEETEACFALPLCEVFAHFARRNATRSTAKTERSNQMGSSDNGGAHTSIEMSANFGAPLSLRAKRKVSSAEFCLLCQGDHPQTPRTVKRSADVARPNKLDKTPRNISSSCVRDLLTLWPGFWAC
jgi:hypothetical protein